MHTVALWISVHLVVSLQYMNINKQTNPFNKQQLDSYKLFNKELASTLL